MWTNNSADGTRLIRALDVERKHVFTSGIMKLLILEVPQDPVWSR